MDENISVLKGLGLTMYEAQAYLTLTSLISSTASEVAEKSGIPRSKIYDVLKKLNEKNYIEIDCSGATFKLISKEILKSRLLEIIDVNKKSISFSQWEKTSLSSVELEVINYYNNNTKKLNEISDFFKISEKTIRGYLNRGVKSGICLYDPIREKNKGLLNGRKGNNYLNRDYFRKYEFFAVKWVEKNIVFKNPYEASIILREKYNIITTYYKIAYVALGKIKTTKGQKFVRV